MQAALEIKAYALASGLSVTSEMPLLQAHMKVERPYMLG
jgi:hypothetical protein